MINHADSSRSEARFSGAQSESVLNNCVWPKSTRANLDRLGIRFPIIQAPMAGGPSSSELVKAVMGAGALGSVAAGYLSGERLGALLKDISNEGLRPFAVNLMVPTNDEKRAPSEKVVEAINSARETLNLSTLRLPEVINDIFMDQVKTVLAHNVRIVSFTFGVPPPELMRDLKTRGILTMGTATTVSEARLIAECGCDFVIAQGSEAGGHRGGFLNVDNPANIGTLSLVPQIVDAVKCPVVAAGGIMDGRGLAAALCLGASLVQMGTAFMGCPEAGVTESWRSALRSSSDESTTLTNAFTGKYARAIKNAFIEKLGGLSKEVGSYPVQHYYTAELREQSKKLNNPEFQSLWAGQSSALIRSLGAASLVEAVVGEAQGILAQ